MQSGIEIMPRRIRAIIGLMGLALILFLYFMMFIPGPGNVVVFPSMGNGWFVLSIVLVGVALISLAALTSLLPFEKFDQIAIAQIVGIWFIVIPVFVFFAVVPRPPGEQLDHVKFDGKNFHLFVDQESLYTQQFQPDLNGQPVPINVLNCTVTRRLFTCDAFNMFCETFEAPITTSYQLNEPNIPPDQQCPAVPGSFSPSDEALFFSVGSESFTVGGVGSINQ